MQKMVRELNMNLEVIVCPTIREKDGLAMSSRNTYLTPEERQVAPVLYKSLMLAKEMHAKGEHDAVEIRKAMTEMITAVPQAQIDYISIASLDTLDEINEINGKALISLAVKLGKPRLIDNIIIA
jgi:pantoate--beta-alanine ligase